MSSTDYQFRLKDAAIGAQMLLIAFGSLVLVPILTGLDAAVTLFTAGAGTLLFQWITKGKVPVFLASSFAFIPPIIFGVQQWGVAGTLSGLFAAGVVYLLLSGLVRWRGVRALEYFLPATVTGPVIMVIGLSLAPVAVNLALGKTGDGSAVLVPADKALLISMAALLTAMIASLKGRGVVKLLPVLLGVAVGFILSLFMGIVNFEPVLQANWFSVPAFVFPQWNWEAVLFIVPVAIAPAIEHFGDILAISSVTGKNYLKDPGVDKTLLGDGLATMLAALCGGPPNTTYSEVTGGVAITRVFNPAIMTWASLFAILLSLFGKLGAFLQCLPTPVIGGILILLFGAITVVGMNTLMNSGRDLSESRNLIIVSIILVFGVGGMSLSLGKFTLAGVGLAGIVGVFLNFILPRSAPK